MPHRRTWDTELMDRILFWVVQLQGQQSFFSTQLSPDRHRGWPPHPSQRSGGCSTIIEEREVSWSWQHPSRTGPSGWRGHNHRSHDNLKQDLSRLCPWSSHFPRTATCSSARTTERSDSSATQAKSCWRSYWSDWSYKRRRSLLKNRQASQQEGAGNAGWTTSKSGHPCPCQNCSLGPPAKKTGSGSLLNRPSCSPATNLVKGLYWTTA